MSTRQLTRGRTRFLLASAAMLATTYAGHAAAQVAAAPAGTKQAASAAAQPSNELAELIVTARKRSESLQKVPVAVSVVSGDLVRQQNRNNVTDLISMIPSVDLRPQPSNKDVDLLIRGLGTITTSAGVEATVSTVVDGVVLARPGQMVSDLLDLDRIEVLRGPQGTLFGKNASAGVINIVTKNPTPEPGGYLEGSYYEGDQYRLTGVANGEIIKDVLSGRLAAVTSSYKGNITNLYNGSTVNGFRSEGARAKLLYTPTNKLSILFGADYMYTNSSFAPEVYLTNSNVAYPSGRVTFNNNLLAALANEGITPHFGNTQISLDTQPNDKDLSAGVFAQADYTFGDYTLTSITAYRYWRNVQRQDIDVFSGLTSLTPTKLADLGHVRTRQYSEELRLSSPKGGFIDYVIGAYFLHAPDKEDYRRDTTQLTSSGLVSNYGFNKFGATATNYSVFGEANINFTESFRAIAGLRLVRDNLRFYTDRFSTSPTPVPGVQPSFAASGSTKVTDYADRLGLQYDVNSDIHTYVTYSRGYKGPAYNVFFNMNALQTNKLNPETSNDFEVGVKSSLFERRAQLDIALFDDKVSNYQANEPDIVAGTVVTRLINAGKVSTKGVEVDLAARATEDLTLNANYAYVDAKIDRFNCPPGAAASCDVNGKPLPFAPKNKLTLGAQYVAYSSDRFRVELSSHYSYQSSQQNSITQTPDTVSPGYGIWNAALALTDQKLDWSARLMVFNILNKHYYSSLGEVNGGLIGGLPRDYSRYVGITLRKDF